MNISKKLIKNIIFSPLKLLNFTALTYLKPFGLIGGSFPYLWDDYQWRRIFNKTAMIRHGTNENKTEIEFFIPNPICRMRAFSFSKKEPETLDWLDKTLGRGVFFDIGANVGVYSIYYAKKFENKVIAFEPSFFNLPVLVKNINKNKLEELVTIMPLPLNSSNCESDFVLSTDELGGAMSTFIANENKQSSSNSSSQMSYKVHGFSLDGLYKSEVLNVYPSFIKIDVDGIEFEILKGAVNTLSNPAVRSLLVEVDYTDEEGLNNITDLLSKLNFQKVYESKKNKYGNQIWDKRI